MRSSSFGFHSHKVVNMDFVREETPPRFVMVAAGVQRGL
jgi:hypothetical protein